MSVAKAIPAGKIKPLSTSEILKIAAGEVIVRPASVIKELVENSLDAGACSIAVKIINAGKTLVSVSDNGFGMSEVDCKNSVLAHWTSKIDSFTDLDKIVSRGFRGEALASISAVSDLTIKTCLRGSSEGCEISFSGQKVVEHKGIVGGISGTTVLVKNLFSNVPARLKFLKQDKTELSQITQTLEVLAMINWAIELTLEVDGKIILDLPAAVSQKERLVQVLGLAVGEQLVEVSSICKSVNGFVSRPTTTRYSRNYIFLSANLRPIRDSKIANAIIAGYTRMLEPGKYPIAFLSVTVPGEAIDFNIHPCKDEVKFIDYSALCKRVKESVSKALGQSSFSPSVLANPRNPLYQDSFIGLEDENSLDFLQFSSVYSGLQPLLAQEKEAEKVINKQLWSDAGEQEAEKDFKGLEPLWETDRFNDKAQPNQLSIPVISPAKVWTVDQQTNIPEQTEQERVEFKIVGQLFNTIIVVALADSIVMIDQHAAHERILYQKALARPEVLKNKLLCPEVITFSPNEIEVLIGAKDVFALCGFDLEVFGKNQIVIKTTPAGVGLGVTKEIIKEFLQTHSFSGSSQSSPEESVKFFLFSQISCKSAVKAGDGLGQIQMQALVSDLMICENNTQCIHGRPTMWTLSKNEIFKHFKRF